MEQFGNLPLHKRYNEIEMKKAISNRYKNISKAIPRQLEYLGESKEFAAIVKKLRRDGWKDWHILLSIINQMLNLKHFIGKTGWYPKTEEEKNEILNFKEEEYFQPFCISEFSEEKLYFHLKGALITGCKGMGFEFRKRDIKPGKIEKFLRMRMKYFDLDVPHKTYFPLADEELYVNKPT